MAGSCGSPCQHGPRRAIRFELGLGSHVCNATPLLTERLAMSVLIRAHPDSSSCDVASAGRARYLKRSVRGSRADEGRRSGRAREVPSERRRARCPPSSSTPATLPIQDARSTMRPSELIDYTAYLLDAVAAVRAALTSSADKAQADRARDKVRALREEAKYRQAHLHKVYLRSLTDSSVGSIASVSCRAWCGWSGRHCGWVRKVRSQLTRTIP